MGSPAYKDISYGDHPQQVFDLYIPGTEGNLPLIILVHGGGFYCCDKTDFHTRPIPVFLRMGFAVASVNYRMAPDFPWPYPQQDLDRCIRYLREEGRKWKIDTEKVFLHGTSAGGNLAAIEALLASSSEEIRAAALLCPLISLDRMEEDLAVSGFAEEENLEELKKIRLLYLKGKKRLEADADYYISNQSAYHVPLYIQHGNCDRLVSLRQSENFAEKLTRAGWKDIVLDILEGADHAGAGDDFFREETVRRIGCFFKEYM